MANNFKPWVDLPVKQVQSADVFAKDLQRVDGFKAGDAASALRVNSALRQANVVVAGLMQMCDDIKTLPNGLSLVSTVAQIKNAIKAAIDQLDATVLANAKQYTDTREEAVNGKITNLQNQVVTNKNSIDTHETRLNNIDDEIAGLSGGTSTLTTRVGTLEIKMTAAETNIKNLQAYYEVDLEAGSWDSSDGTYIYTIDAATHKRGIRPRVHTYVNDEETYNSSKIDWTTGNVTLYSNIQVAMKVLIY
jgi:hypothetical protein|nr:MAG TPA: tail-needle protein [Caudoviricetes sp.]